MNAGRATVRESGIGYAVRVDGVAGQSRRAIEPLGSGRITIERHRFVRDRAAASAIAPTALSLLAHAACLLACLLFLPSQMILPDIPGTARVALVFEPTPAAPAAVSERPPAPVPPMDAALAPVSPSAPMQQPPPAPVPAAAVPELAAAVPEPPAAAASVPKPPVPTPALAAAVPVDVGRSVPALPPPREQPAAARPQPARPVAVHPHGAPARTLASLTLPPSAAPTEASSAETSAAQIAAATSVIPPRPVAGMETNRAPTYPEIALRRGEAGRVMLRVSVSADGQPLEVDVAQTSGYPSLDAAARSAVRRWRFVPATRAGSAVAAIAEVPVRFRIDN
jgi:periplasmic protein TonB